MFKFLAVLLAVFVLAFATPAAASPFVYSDPYPPEGNLTDGDPPNPDSFILILDNGAPQLVPAFTLPDGRVMLKADIGTVARGRHILKIKANHTLWGESVEVPFTFRAGRPDPASGVGLQK